MVDAGKPTALAVIVVSLFIGCNAFSMSHRTVASQSLKQRCRRRMHQKVIHATTSKYSAASSDHEAIPPPSQAPPFAQKLNSSTKWLVTLAQTLSVWTRPHVYLGPYIVVGSIASVFLTNVLKKMFNQARPDGSPLTDPGMPSSHALVCFFAASAWVGVLAPSAAEAAAAGARYSLAQVGQALILASASVVAGLRVVCGYHSIDQILVGAGLGSLMGVSWLRLGQMFARRHPSLTLQVAWVAYLSGSALFIRKKMAKWMTTDKNV